MRLYLSTSVLFVVLVLTAALLTAELTEEDKYIKYYHNDPYAQRCWAHLRDVYFAKEKEHLKLICSEFHKLAGKGSTAVDEVKLTINILRFRNSSYFPARVDVVTYGINSTDRVDYFYVTEGLRTDCAYYLMPVKTEADWPEFQLDQHVCGVSTSMFEW